MKHDFKALNSSNRVNKYQSGKHMKGGGGDAVSGVLGVHTGLWSPRARC